MGVELTHQLVQLPELVRQFSDATVILHATIAQHAGLTGSDHKYLGLLVQHGSLSAGEWAKLTGLSTGAITGLIDRLEKKALVKRTPDAHDRRKQIIVPDMTQVSLLFGEVFGTLQSQTAAFIATMAPSEVAAVTRYLQATIGIMERVTESLNQQLSAKNN